MVGVWLAVIPCTLDCLGPKPGFNALSPRAARAFHRPTLHVRRVVRSHPPIPLTLSLTLHLECFTELTRPYSMPARDPGATGKLEGFAALNVASATASASPGSFPALVLNADYRPLSYYPLSL